MHFAAILALLVTIWFVWDDVAALSDALESRQPVNIAKAVVGVATPTVVQAGMAVYEGVEVTDNPESKPCAPHLPCMPAQHDTPITPPLITIID